MPLPVPIDRGVHTTRTALPDCARTRQSSATVRNFRQSSTRGGGAAQTASTTYYRPVTGGLWGGGGDDTRCSSSGHLISCHFQFRRLEIPPALTQTRTRANPEPSPPLPSVAGGGNKFNLYEFQIVPSWCRDASFPVNGRVSRTSFLTTRRDL